jgi:hypothetical protein
MNKLAYIVIAAAVGGLSAPAASAQEGDMQAQGVINNIIDGLIGNRYAVGDRQAIRRCGWAAVDKAERQFRTQFRGRRGFAYPGYRGYVRVAAITDVSRGLLGRVRVTGLLDTGRNGYGGRHGADLTFRCDANRNGHVTDVRVSRNPHYRPR